MKRTKFLNYLAKAAVITGIVGTLGACSFVQLSDAGSNVTQAHGADVTQCQSIGIVSATTKEKVGIKRGAAKVAEELLVLARNEAGKLGANAIVAINQPKGGEQSFRAYKC